MPGTAVYIWGDVENRVTPEQQAVLVDLLIEHYDATRGVSDDTREEAQEVAAVVLGASWTRGRCQCGVEDR